MSKDIAEVGINVFLVGDSISRISCGPILDTAIARVELSDKGAVSCTQVLTSQKRFRFQKGIICDGSRLVAVRHDKKCIEDLIVTDVPHSWKHVWGTPRSTPSLGVTEAHMLSSQGGRSTGEKDRTEQDEPRRCLRTQPKERTGAPI